MQKSQSRKQAEIKNWLNQDPDGPNGTTDLDTDASFSEKKNLTTEIFLEQRKWAEKNDLALNKLIEKDGKLIQLIPNKNLNLSYSPSTQEIKVDCLDPTKSENLVSVWNLFQSDRHFLNQKTLFNWEEIFSPELAWALALQMLCGTDSGSSGSSKLLPDDSEIKFELEKLDLLIGNWPASWKRLLGLTETEAKDSKPLELTENDIWRVYKNKTETNLSFQNSGIFAAEKNQTLNLTTENLKNKIIGDLIGRFCKISSRKSENFSKSLPKSVIQEFFAAFSFVRSKILIESFGKDLDAFGKLFFEKFFSKKLAKQGFSSEILISELSSKLGQNDLVFSGEKIVDWVVDYDQKWVQSKIEDFWQQRAENSDLFSFGDLYALKCSNTQKFVMDYFLNSNKGNFLRLFFYFKSL